MRLDQYDISQIAEKHGTPFFLYDCDQVTAHLTKLQSALPDFVGVYYAVKANPNRVLVEAFKGVVPGLDISSGGEVEMAASVGWSPQVMSFAGPGKSDAELQQALAAGVGSLSIESVGEMRRLSAMAEAVGKRQPVLIRINPPSTPRAFAMRMGGLPSQFGIPEEEASLALKEALSLKGLKVRGIHIFAGTQCLELDALIENIQATLATAKRLADEHDLRFEEVNLGGGAGVAYFSGQEEIDPEQFSQRLGGVLRDFVGSEPRFSNTHFVLELGRYLIGRFGVYVAKVVTLKDVRDKRFVILNGGMNHCFPATGNFGQLIKKNYPITNLSRPHAAQELPQEVVGPLCTPLDSMARGLPLPPTQVGDLIAFDNCGAYAYTASPLLFLSHATPIELLAKNGDVSVARRPIKASEFY